MRTTSAAFANRLRAESKDRNTQIRAAYRLCYLREPSPDDLSRFLTFFIEADPKAPDPLASFCQALLSTARFRNLD